MKNEPKKNAPMVVVNDDGTKALEEFVLPILMDFKLVRNYYVIMDSLCNCYFT